MHGFYPACVVWCWAVHIGWASGQGGAYSVRGIHPTTDTPGAMSHMRCLSNHSGVLVEGSGSVMNGGNSAGIQGCLVSRLFG